MLGRYIYMTWWKFPYITKRCFSISDVIKPSSQPLTWSHLGTCTKKKRHMQDFTSTFHLHSATSLFVFFSWYHLRKYSYLQINIGNGIHQVQIPNLKTFVSHLTKIMHSSVRKPGTFVMWWVFHSFHSFFFFFFLFKW